MKKAKMPKAIPSARPATFFVIRSPLLSPAARLEPDDVVANPLMREALELASSSLLDALEGRRKSHTSPWPAALRYVQRMHGRSVPFSLMAGYAFGDAGDKQTSIELVPVEAQRRIIRLGLDCVGRLVANRAKERPDETMWVARKDLVSFPDLIRVASRELGRNQVHLADVVRSDAVNNVLRDAKGPRLLSFLVEHTLADWDPGDARQFVESLIEHNVLVPSSTPSPIIEDELAALDKIGLPEIAAAARSVRETSLAEPPRERVNALRAAIVARGGSTGKDDLVYDLMKPTVRATLGKDVLGEASQVVDILQRLVPLREDSRLVDLASRFTQRYGDRKAPLLEALDPHRGFAFPSGGRLQPRDPNEWARYQAKVLRLFEDALRSGRDEVAITSDMLEREPLWLPPESYSLSFELGLDPIMLWCPTLTPPPGTHLFARATAISEELLQRVRGFLDSVSSESPDFDFLDVSYFVPGGPVEAAQHPRLQKQELCLTSVSAGTLVIDPNDVLISVSRGRVCLHSRNTGRPLLVRITDAMDASAGNSTDVARFLYALPFSPSPANWDWGALEPAKRLPRVRWKEHVIAPATWNFDAQDTLQLRKADSKSSRWDAAQRLRKTHGLPRHLTVQEGGSDSRLPLDLDDPWSVEAWLDVVREGMQLTESFAISRSAVTGFEGRYHHRIVLPFLGTPHTNASHYPSSTDGSPVRFALGSSVLCASLWGDANELVSIALEVASNIVASAQPGELDHWLFLPSLDPNPKVSVVLFGLTDSNYVAFVEAIRDSLHPLLAAGAINRVAFDTYERDVARYGGTGGAEAAERCFCLSSQIAQKMLEERSFSCGAEETTEVITPIVVSLRAILVCCGLPLSDLLTIAKIAAETHGSTTSDTKIWAGELFRTIRHELPPEADPNLVFDARVAVGLKLNLHELFETAKTSGGSHMVQDLAVHVLHTHVMRLLTPWHPVRRLESAAYHVLAKWIESDRARETPVASRRDPSD